MLSQTIQKEQELRGSQVRVFSLSPGIVDTGMQEQIRHADQQKFSSVERFKGYKENGELASPEEVGKKIAAFLQKTDQYNEVLVSVRDME